VQRGDIENGVIVSAAAQSAFSSILAEVPTIDLDFIPGTSTPGVDGFTELDFSGLNGENNPVRSNIGQTEAVNGVGNGETARYENVGLIDGVAIDIQATVITSSGIAPGFNIQGGDNANVNLGGGTVNQARIRWDVFISGTDTPITGNFTALVNDLDGRANGANFESIEIAADQVDAYALEDDTVITVQENNGVLVVIPTAPDPGTPGVLPENTIQLTFSNTSSFEIFYNRNNGGANFSLDGNFEAGFFGNPTVVDTNSDFANVFTEGQDPVAISADTIQITDDANISQATITITNPEASDRINVPASLPPGITVASSSDNQIVLTGDATPDAYEAAILAITFENTSNDPNETTVRAIEITITDDEAQTSNTATASIQVVAVDGPTGPDHSFVDWTAFTPNGNDGTIVGTLDVDGTSVDVTGTGNINTFNANGNLGNTHTEESANFFSNQARFPDAPNPSDAVGAVFSSASPTFEFTIDSGEQFVDPIIYIADIDIDRAYSLGVPFTVLGTPSNDLTIDAANGTFSASALGQGLTIRLDGTHSAITIARLSGATDTLRIHLCVTDIEAAAVNQSPDAIDDAATTDEDTATNGNVLVDNGSGADSDPESDPLVVSAVGSVDANVGAAVAGSNGGVFTIDSNGDFTFDPNGDFTFLDTGETATTSVTYTISDGNGGTDTATLTVTLIGDNDAPIVDLNGSLPGSDYTAEFIEDQPGEPLANLLTFDAVIEDPEDNIGTVTITVNLPDPNDGADEFFRIDQGDLQLSINLGTGEVVASNPLTFGETTFDVVFEDGVITITNADETQDYVESDDLLSAKLWRQRR